MGNNLWCRLSLIERPIDSSRHRGVVLSRDPEVLFVIRHNAINPKVSPVVTQTAGCA